MELCTNGSYKLLRIIGILMLLLSSAPFVLAYIECSTVSQLFSACSIFISYGTPDPIPGSPCCDAMLGLSIIANSGDNKQSVCRCIMGLLQNYSTNATAIGTLPGLCGISLGFTIIPNPQCIL
ncbi:putative non-specific lipid-transfer protein 14 [Trifolium pratense]|uniref:putative non-specific lipid-transfer protein 14 n=1 Tax=Trifolium pratense TaxID=57577 RepID=UPI001E69780E|nr:putative non-specific lipid-transfer protein 14 [Trifolium pratense]